MQPSRLTREEIDRWERAVAGAGQLLLDLGRSPEPLSMALTSLTPLSPHPEDEAQAVSSSDAFGGVALCAPENVVELARTLVHEFGHMKLHAVMDSTDLYEPEDEAPAPQELYYAPWREDPRPLSGLLHGVFVHIDVVDFCRRLVTKASGIALRHAQFELAYLQAQTRDVFTALRESPKLTEAGRFFVDTIMTWTDDEDVPDGVRALAMEAAVAHRVRWRLRHLLPASSAVDELAAAWATGAPPSSCLPGPHTPRGNRSLGPGSPGRRCRSGTSPRRRPGDTAADPGGALGPARSGLAPLRPTGACAGCRRRTASALPDLVPRGRPSCPRPRRRDDRPYAGPQRPGRLAGPSDRYH
ncbi:HEXXH motif-containing putative peptide modification protein [Streptomyces sp. NPDC058052]|uniref:aKG-HExxH-type peptide beta-hydroxylase n=1 Tax=Streptomyces sp. NPDC058052 TaxID=3346316 RepID=UPI0036E29337